MAALLLPSRRVVQPQGLVEIDNRHGLRPIGLYVPSYGRFDAGNGKPFLGGSALTVRAGAAGLSAIQTATNTGLYRAVPDFTPSAEITAIWHGVPLGTPAGSTPALVSLGSSTTSQSNAPLSIEYISASSLTVHFKSASSDSSRSGSFTWADAIGKKTTFIASYSVDEALIRLNVCVDGVSFRVIEAVVSSPSAATALGTEQFTVGPDVVEQPSRHINSQVALAGVFYGRLREGALADTLQNPWQLFKPIERRIWIAAGGAPAGVTLTGNNTQTLHTSSSAAIAQTHLLAGNAAQQTNASSTGAIVGALPTLVQPVSTTTTGGWTPTGAPTLHQALNEPVPSALEYISTTTASLCEMELANSAFPGTANQALAYRASSTLGSTLTVTLKQGATTIAVRSHPLTSTDTLYTQTLTAPEIANIVAGPISVTLAAA